MFLAEICTSKIFKIRPTLSRLINNNHSQGTLWTHSTRVSMMYGRQSARYTQRLTGAIIFMESQMCIFQVTTDQVSKYV